ncbi:TPA: ATP-dependent RecD-like DNA helicase [bacterium]|nr:ATP-dependent RecD-like DNA helicase [bacterium]
MDEIIAKVKVVLFHNEDNMYSVIKVKVEDTTDNDYLTITGNFPLLDINSVYKFKGEYVSHPRYGKQFNLSQYEKVLPNSKEGVIRYLSSPLFPGIGNKKASTIVRFIGEDALNKIRENPDILNNLVSEKDKFSIIEGLKEENFFEEAVQMFVTQGLSMKMLLKIRAVYGDKMNEVIKENPYKLVEDIDGIGFNTADNFALTIGIETLDERRIKAAIIASIDNICFRDGDTYCSIEEIKKETRKLVKELDDKSFYYFVELLIEDNKIVREEDKFYSLKQYEAEIGNAKSLTRFIKRIVSKVEEKDVREIIEKIEKIEGIEYDEDQINAIINCLNSGISIITGGPGTGKTTIVKALVKIYQELLESNDIYLCAPTGRASKRLSELTGVDATTIHRLLKWDLHSNTFSINAANPLLGDLLIIDEFSMVDNLLFYNLMSATSNFSQIVLIGDDDQLPSVGPGNVLKDLLDSGLVNTIKLTKIYRQKDESNIISLAHHIKSNSSVSEDFRNDVVFYNTNSVNIKNTVLNYVKIAVENGFNDDEIQVLAPMYLGMNGIDNLNELLQNYFNPASEDKKEFRVGKRIYRENDKILQLKNQNEDNVYNGDIGRLLEITKELNTTKFLIDFDDNLVEYTNKDLINITHAYCISIHKSQGSEYPLVIMPVTNQYHHMLTKKLLYTGVTRAKQKLILVGDYNSFLYGITNTNYRTRKTNLKHFLELFVNKL